jgi:magnesium-transporting ATPase (P-type)
VKDVMWGRNVYERIEKLIKLKINVNVVDVIVELIGECDVKERNIKDVKMLWVKLIMENLDYMELENELKKNDILMRKKYGSKKKII